MTFRLPELVRRVAVIVPTLLLAIGQPTGAQVSDPVLGAPPAAGSVYDDRGVLANLGFNISAAFPRGEFATNVGAGLGLTGDVSIRLLRAGWLGLRLDGGMIWYGYETEDEQTTVGRVRIPVELTTTNTILLVGLGPQIHAAGYPMNADVYALVGVSRFETRTSARLDRSDLNDSDLHLNSTVHLRDWTPSITLGGEVNWTIDGDRQGFLLGITLGLEYRRHGPTRYLNADSIDRVEARTTLTPFETRADFWLLRIGLRGGTW